MTGRLCAAILATLIAASPLAVPATAGDHHRAVGVPRDSHGRILRSHAAVREFERLTGHQHGWPGHRIDHVIPLACHGPDTPANMQWLTVDEWKAKSKWERRGC